MATTSRMVTLCLPENDAKELYSFLAGPLDGKDPVLGFAVRERVVTRVHQALRDVQVRSQL
ncbi:hypothetical protein [Kibdelosporangium phytohabitans]|uniref:hypothetical protein n=1 Tax=Kibdelosporangium phytohabitans TaxID=860235 RepID=UPI0012FA2BC8|nr:hypothetical protein [Kibdelosporangium phytohabitans]MBE1467565.1 hypothetical protein [Kibdelosporangium phytohabitans]